MLLDALEKIRSGNLNAFSDLYDISYDKIYRFIFHRTLDDILTEDIISDVYMKILENFKNFKGNTESEFFAWIYRIAYTTLIDTIRRNKPEDSIDEMEIEPGFTQDFARSIDAKSKLEEVLRFMDTLSEREKTILTMRIWDDLSYEEISTITGESISNAKQIVSRTLAKISANVANLFILSFLLYVAER